MNRIKTLLENKQDLLTIFYTAGYPALEDTMPTLEHLEAEGVDMVEIGIPFSDPVADGPVIQQANLQAIHNGMTVPMLLKQIQRMREKVTIPVLVMSSINPILQYGMERFCEQCAAIGIDALILPDLPIDVYQNQYRRLFERHHMHNILLITPTTPADRIRQIDEQSTGFIYMVSSSSITGMRGQFTAEQIAYFDRIKSMKLNTGALIGFGILDHKTFRQACKYANGGIIGSAFVNALKEQGSLDDKISAFVKRIKA